MAHTLSDVEYAAIHLKVPESGTPWLDGMIKKSLGYKELGELHTEVCDALRQVGCAHTMSPSAARLLQDRCAELLAKLEAL